MSEKRQNKNVAANDMSSAATLERITGVEPAYAAWEAAVLPMNYIRKDQAVRGIITEVFPVCNVKNVGSGMNILPAA